MKKSLIIISSVLLLTLAIFGSSNAASKETAGRWQDLDNWRFAPRIGFSGYIGVIGIEAQNKNWAFTLGLPGSFGIKYYIKPNGHSLFVGGFILNYDISSEYGLYRTTGTITGLGCGHRWLWADHWDLTLNLAVAYVDAKEKDGPLTYTTKAYTVLPGVTFGYLF